MLHIVDAAEREEFNGTKIMFIEQHLLVTMYTQEVIITIRDSTNMHNN